ncbi:MAG: type II toxin-antitoxin system Phd/YefM family antitoxin [Candidatus Manganitrophaceae bacterium]|nr:MAG: type II toxin-antitoxin system Phd/YefM family antitoxin [Candidatus Manganitrophaceae bacterium]
MKAKLTEDIIPVTDFRTNAAELLEKIKKTRRPLILTQRGRSAAVVEDMKEYEDRLDRLELLEAIVQGLQAAERGEVVSHEEAMRRLDSLLNG